MLLENFYTENNTHLRVSRQQASAFAKHVAGDYNPIHDTEAKRFCVPGDLLFSLVLSKYGLSQHMRFTFSGMVGDNVSLSFPPSQETTLRICNAAGKEYLQVERQGSIKKDTVLINALIQRYVAFSGQTFPHILVPLMAEKGMMINPERPLVIYESMAIQLEDLDISHPELHLTESSMEIQGKRGDVRLKFTITADGVPVGSGEKSMVLSGLRPYEADRVEQLIHDYEIRKRTITHASQNQGRQTS